MRHQGGKGRTAFTPLFRLALCATAPRADNVSTRDPAAQQCQMPIRSNNSNERCTNASRPSPSLLAHVPRCDVNTRDQTRVWACRAADKRYRCLLARTVNLVDVGQVDTVPWVPGDAPAVCAFPSAHFS